MKVNIGDYPKGGKPRKVKVEISGNDCYCLFATLALVIAPALVKYRKYAEGVTPGCMMSEEHWQLCGVLPKTKAQKKLMAKYDKQAKKKWLDTLDAMIWSFETIGKSEPEPYDEAERKAYDAKMEYGLKLFAEYYFTLWF